MMLQPVRVLDAVKEPVTVAPWISTMGDFLSLPLRTYSSGMMLRLAFAVSTAVTPEILIMDEPIGAGDAGFFATAEARLNRLSGRSRILVIASHAEDMLRRLCNKAALMEEG